MGLSRRGWSAFWNRGGWWRALIVVVAYWGLYQLCGLLVGAVFGSFIDTENVLGSSLSVFFGMTLPILLGAVLLLLFAQSAGLLRGLFARQPVRGRAWMWVAVAAVILPIVLRLIGTNWSAYEVATVLSILFLGLAIGFTEELLTRGVVVNMMRQGGSGERVVLVISSLYFALLHAGNLITGQPLATVALTVAYTFGFGAMMYLSMRVTGSIVWAMLLHAATDPTTILAVGGVDTHSETGGTGNAIAIAGLFNIGYILLALVAIFLVKNHHTERTEAAQ